MTTRHLGWKFVDANLKRRDVQYVVGQWTDPIPNPVPCRQGYHWCRDPRDLILEHATYGPVILQVEACDAIDDGTKTVSSRLYVHRQTPWDAVRWRLWAADCAERVVHIYETRYPGDQRPRNAIEATRRLAFGTSTGAAGDAAWAAARDAGAAAWAAAGAAGAAAWAAARDAARAAGDAARDAARAAAWAAAGAAEARWQSARLTAYLDGYLPIPPQGDR